MGSCDNEGTYVASLPECRNTLTASRGGVCRRADLSTELLLSMARFPRRPQAE